MVEKVKQSNIEFLRIIAMLMIVAHHFCVHGIFPVWKINSNFLEFINSVIVSICSMGGKLGVDIFILITGYFMITSNWKFKHIVQIYLKMFIYSILFLLIYILDSDSITSTVLNTSLFPFGGNAYWFITAYLMLYFFVPYLNKLILNSDNKQLNFLMSITTLLWVIIPTFSKADYAFSNLLWFMYLYFVGASLRIKKYGEIFNNQKLINISALISIIYLVSYAFIKCLRPEINLWTMCKPSGLNTFLLCL